MPFGEIKVWAEVSWLAEGPLLLHDTHFHFSKSFICLCIHSKRYLLNISHVQIYYSRKYTLGSILLLTDWFIYLFVCLFYCCSSIVVSIFLPPLLRPCFSSRVWIPCFLQSQNINMEHMFIQRHECLWKLYL